MAREEFEKELKALNRDELNKFAESEHGIENASEYPNMGSLRDAIMKGYKEVEHTATGKPNKKADTAKTVRPNRQILYTSEKKK